MKKLNLVVLISMDQGEKLLMFCFFFKIPNSSYVQITIQLSGFMNWTFELHKVCDWVPGQKHP